MVAKNKKQVQSENALNQDAIPHRIWTSEQLLGSKQSTHIHHGGQVYILRRTRNGKLILTA